MWIIWSQEQYSENEKDYFCLNCLSWLLFQYPEIALYEAHAMNLCHFNSYTFPSSRMFLMWMQAYLKSYHPLFWNILRIEYISTNRAYI